MRTTRGPLAITFAFILLLSFILWLGTQSLPAQLLPFFSSPLTFWTTLGIGFGCVFFACWRLYWGSRWAISEFEAMAFLRNRINDVVHEGAFFYPAAETIDESMLFGESDVVRRRHLRTITGQIAATIYRDSRFFRFEPMHMLVGARRIEATSYSTRISGWQTIAVRLGILATFVGLLRSLGEVQQVFLLRGSSIANSGKVSAGTELSAMQDRIGLLMGDIVHGLSLAFGTSIAGIAAALIIIFMAGLARKTEVKILTDLQDVGFVLQKFLRDRSTGNEAIVKTAADLRTAMEIQTRALTDIRKDLDHHSKNLSETAGIVGNGLAGPVALFSENALGLRDLLVQTAATSAALETLQRRSQAIEEQTVSKLETLTDRLGATITSNGEQLRQAMEHNQRAIADAMTRISTAAADNAALLVTQFAESLKKSVGGELQQAVLGELLKQMDAASTKHDVAAMQIRQAGARHARGALVIFAIGIAAVCASSLSVVYWRSAQTDAHATAESLPAVPDRKSQDVR